MRAYDVVVVMPLAEEFDTVKRVFDIERSFIRNRITFYELSLADSDRERPELDIVAVVLSQMGNANAAQKTERVLSMIDSPGPRLVTLVGIAGRLDDDLGLGDVVVGTEVTNYQIRSKLAENVTEDGSDNDTTESETQTASDDSSDEVPATDTFADTDMSLPLVNWEPGGRTYVVAPEVTEAVARFRNDPDHHETWCRETTRQVENWVRSEADDEKLPPGIGGPARTEDDDEQLTDEQFHTPLQAVNEPLASGSFVITSEEFTKKLSQQNRNFAAVEMEAAGVLLAVQRTTGVNGLVIRGISDLADDGKADLEDMGPDGGLWRQCAAFAAANYVAHFISEGYVAVAESPEKRPTSHRNHVLTSEDNERDSIAVSELSASDFDVETTGPARNYVRQYVGSTRPTIKSDPPEDGVTVTVDFEVRVPVSLQLRRVSIETAAITSEATRSQDVYIDGVQHTTKEGTEQYLQQPVDVHPGESVSLRLECHCVLSDSSHLSDELGNSVSVSVICEFDTPDSGSSLQYRLQGYIDQIRGLHLTEQKVS